MAITDEIKEQKKKLSNMTWKEKAKYFWDYYKIHTVVVFFVLILGGCLIKDIFTDNQTSVFQAAIVNSELQYMDESCEKKFADDLKIDPKKECVIFDNSYRIQVDGTDQMTVASSQKMIANAQVELLDVIIAPSDVIDYYAMNSFFMDLRNILSKEQMEDFLTQDKIYYAVNEEGTKVPVGIYIDDSNLVRQTELYVTEKPILGCLQNTTHADHILDFLTFIYEDDFTSE